MITKIPFDIVCFEVEKLYLKDIDESINEQVEKHSEFITNFINACGYTFDEYMFLWSGLNKLN